MMSDYRIMDECPGNLEGAVLNVGGDDVNANVTHDLNRVQQLPDTNIVVQGKKWNIEDIESRLLSMEDVLNEKMLSIQERLDERILELSKRFEDKLCSLQTALEESDERKRKSISVEDEAEVGTNNEEPPVQTSGSLVGELRGSEKSVLASSLLEVDSQQVFSKTSSTSEEISSLVCRVDALEIAVQRALETLFPRVEMLLQKFEDKQTAEHRGGLGGDEYPMGKEEAEGKNHSTPIGSPLLSPLHSPLQSPPQSPLFSPRPQSARSGQWTCYTPHPRGQCSAKSAAGAEERSKLNQAFIHAAKLSCTHEMRFYHEQGADVNARDKHGRSALHHAVGSGAGAAGVRAVALLLEWGADATGARAPRGWTPMHEAARAGNAAHVEALAAHGADARAQDECGYTPLHWAAFKGHVQVAASLLALASKAGGAMLALTEDQRGRTALHCAAQQGHAATVHLLAVAMEAEDRSRLDHADAEGATALHAAAAGGHETAVRTLLSSGASTSVKDRLLRTPYDVAKTDAIKKLLKVNYQCRT